MLKVKELTTMDTQPMKVTENVRGVDIDVFIRPINDEIIETIKKRHINGFEWVTNSQGKKVKSDIIDSDGFFDDILDYMLASFNGVGNEAGEEWPSDLEHKKKLISLSVEKGAVPLYERIMEHAKGLAFAIDLEEAGKQKNLQMP